MQGLANTVSQLSTSCGVDCITFTGRTAWETIGRNDRAYKVHFNGVYDVSSIQSSLAVELTKPVKDVRMYLVAMTQLTPTKVVPNGLTKTFVVHDGNTALHVTTIGDHAITSNTYTTLVNSIDVSDETIIGDKVLYWSDLQNLTTTSPPRGAFFTLSQGASAKELVFTCVGAPSDSTGQGGQTFEIKFYYC